MTKNLDSISTPSILACAQITRSTHEATHHLALDKSDRSTALTPMDVMRGSELSAEMVEAEEFLGEAAGAECALLAVGVLGCDAGGQEEGDEELDEEHDEWLLVQVAQ